MRGTGQLVLGSRPNCGGALGCGRARLAFAAIRQRLGVSKPRCKLDAVAKQSAGIPSSTFDILEKDLLYIQDRTGLDLLTPLAPVRDVHDKVVCQNSWHNPPCLVSLYQVLLIYRDIRSIFPRGVVVASHRGVSKLPVVLSLWS